MSEKAFQIYCSGLEEQSNRNQARNIRKNVAEARKGRDIAAQRWPFELLQNALDAGPRGGKRRIDITLRQSDTAIVFEHDGAPFTSSELAALLSGGSSKEFESDVTTGRFGTGFLVTHVLAEHTKLRGILSLEPGYEQFELLLDRGGDEDHIRANILQCKEAIRDATAINSPEGLPSASFEYPFDEEGTILAGVASLRTSLPYLYATRPNLGTFTIELVGNHWETWSPDVIERESFEHHIVESRSISLQRHDVLTEYRVCQILSADAPVAAILLLARKDDTFELCLPTKETPRIFREYPLSRSASLPINLILNGKFEADQERSALLMSDEDKRLLCAAFEAGATAVHFAVSRGWLRSHLLASARPMAAMFHAGSEHEATWWNSRLATFADTLSKMPIVNCEQGLLAAHSECPPYADFAVPSLLSSSANDETTVARVWPLLQDAKDLCPPQELVAEEWTEIAKGWTSLKVPLGMISLQRLATYAKGEATRLEDLHIKGDPKVWIAKFLDVVAECWEQRSGVDSSVLSGLIPNQRGALCIPNKLSRDDGIADLLKDICEAMNLDVRSSLLATGFDVLASDHDLKFLAASLPRIVPDEMTEDDLIENAIQHLNDLLEEDADFDTADSDQRETQKASIRLLSYLWNTRGTFASSLARQMPLLTRRDRFATWSQDRKLMAPVCSWMETARQFEVAYPPNRILADVYAGDAIDGIPDVVPALVAWGLIYADPISTDVPARLEGRRLQLLSNEDTTGVVVTGVEFSQIALLHPEVINRCQESAEEAKALLGLLLCYVIQRDSAWRETRVVKGRKSGEDRDVTVRGALWLADLRFRTWVPVPDGNEGIVKTQANASSLEHLLDPAWLEGNDTAIRLLSECFGFDELDLRLIGLTSDTAVRQEVRNGLARLIESAGADVELFASLAEEIAAKKRRDGDVARYRRLGFAVQEAISEALRAYNLNVELVDHGFDYEVSVSTADGIEDLAIRFAVGSYLVEVKATTTGDACLTPTQAATASAKQDRYVLCVVDLREVGAERLEREWQAADVEALAKLVPSIGEDVFATYGLIELAKNRAVGLRNDSVLRYKVRPDIWEKGQSIAEWVDDVSAKVVTDDKSIENNTS